jgi:tight adherence protein B
MLRSGRLTVPSIRRSPRQPAPREVAAWCDALARDLRSGATLTEALTRVLPADAATARATAALRFALERGVSTPIALTRVERPGEHLHLAMVVLGTVARSGGPAASAVDAAAATLRQRAHDVDGRTVQASQARLSAHVMTAVPILMLAVLASTDPEIRSTMATPVGAGALAAGLVLNVTGWWWMRRIVGGAA